MNDNHKKRKQGADLAIIAALMDEYTKDENDQLCKKIKIEQERVIARDQLIQEYITRQDELERYMRMARASLYNMSRVIRANEAREDIFHPNRRYRKVIAEDNHGIPWVLYIDNFAGQDEALVDLTEDLTTEEEILTDDE